MISVNDFFTRNSCLGKHTLTQKRGRLSPSSLVSSLAPECRCTPQFHPLLKAGWFPAEWFCRPLAFLNGGMTSAPGRRIHLRKCGEKRHAVAHPRSLLCSYYMHFRKNCQDASSRGSKIAAEDARKPYSQNRPPTPPPWLEPLEEVCTLLPKPPPPPP